MINIFKIKKEERCLALVILLYTLVLNALVIIKYYDSFSLLSNNYRRLFLKIFNISGFDPLTYEAVSKWTTSYNIFRHPFLAFFMYIPYQINHGLMLLTGHNCVQFVIAAIYMFFSCYSFIFLYRIFREVIELKRIDSILFTMFTFSFAYVMLATMVPDHFLLSMFMLIVTLYISGLKMKRHLTMTKFQSLILFFFTAGVSLNNGIKTFLATWFVNGKRFWYPKNIIIGVIFPSVMIWGFVRVEYHIFEFPHFKARQIALEKQKAKNKHKVYELYKDTTSEKNQAKIASGVDCILKKQEAETLRRQSLNPGVSHQGKPLGNGTFISWTDISTPRGLTFVENLFGESIQLHQDNLLGDTLKGRPVIVHYRWVFNYVIEGIIVILFALGLFCGRKNKFMWMAVSFMGFDMLLHLGLGFGINEIYIMSPHWAFVITIVIACLAKKMDERKLVAFRMLICCLAAYLLIYNTALIVEYLTIL